MSGSAISRRIHCADLEIIIFDEQEFPQIWGILVHVESLGICGE